MKSRSISSLILVLVASMFVVSSNTATGQAVENIEADAIRCSAGSSFTVTLDSNQTTGYQWELAKDVNANLIKLVGSEYKPAFRPTQAGSKDKESNNHMVGAGGKEIWTFQTIARGKTTIEFKYVRPWEKGVRPDRTMVVPVVIK